MKWRVVAVGRPALRWAREGIDDYARRLRRHAEVELVWVKEGASPEATAQRVLAAAEGCHPVRLDEGGELLSTRDLLARAGEREAAGVKRLAVLVGGADGHPPSLRQAVPEAWALGRQTLQHELATLVWMEQLYRLETLRKGTPYHRG